MLPQGDKLKVLFVRFSAYGDILMCLPALMHYRAQRPQDELHLLLSPRFHGVVQHLPGIAHLHHYDPHRNLGGLDEYVDCAVRLAAERYDAVFNWQANPRSRLLLATVGARQVFSFDRRERTHQHTKCVSTLLDAGLEPPARLTFPPLCGEADRAWARERLRITGSGVQPPLIALGIGGQWETKLWPEDYFVNLMHTLAGDGEVRFVLLGTGPERARGERLRERFAGDCLNLCGETTINHAAAVVGACTLTVSHDTSIMHLAWAQRRPVIGIFGATDPVRTGPLGENSHAFASAQLACHPCFSGRCRRGTNECLRLITPQLVAAQALHMLSRAAPVSPSMNDR